MFTIPLSIGIAQGRRNTTRALFRISPALGTSFHGSVGRQALVSSRTATSHSASTDQDDGVDHIVLLKLKSDVTERQIQSLKDGAASLVKIDGVESVTVGSMFVEDWMQDRRGDQSINYGIRVRLASKECLKVYQSHPDHVKVIKENIAPLLDAPVLAYDWVSPESK